MTEEEIKAVCEKFNIENYKINSDMSINVTSGVKIIDFHDREKITKIPIKVNSVTSHFRCNNNDLTTLENCPDKVDGVFNCEYNNLTSLEYGPIYVGGDYFSCEGNDITSLKHCPVYTGGTFYCSNNPLTSLNDLPINFHVGDSFYCYDISIPDAKEYSKLLFGYIGGKIIINYDHLDKFLNEHKNPPKKDLPRLLSELRKIRL